MSYTIVKGMQSEIFAPVTPPPVWTPVKKPLKDMVVAIATAAGVHCKSDERFNLSGDTGWRKVPDTSKPDELMVSHGGYDNSDVNKDINCMFPYERLHELAKNGIIKGTAKTHATFMGGGGNQEVFKDKTGPEIAEFLKSEGVDAVLLTAGWGTCHRTATIVQRAIEEAGIPTIIIAALPPVVRQNGSPRATAPLVPMGANAGEPHNIEMQYNIVKDSLEELVKITNPGTIVPLPYEYKAKV